MQTGFWRRAEGSWRRSVRSNGSVKETENRFFCLCPLRFGEEFSKAYKIVETNIMKCEARRPASGTVRRLLWKHRIESQQQVIKGSEVKIFCFLLHFKCLVVSVRAFSDANKIEEVHTLSAFSVFPRCLSKQRHFRRFRDETFFGEGRGSHNQGTLWLSLFASKKTSTDLDCSFQNENFMAFLSKETRYVLRRFQCS